MAEYGGHAGGSAAVEAERKREQAYRLLEEARAWEKGAAGEAITASLLAALTPSGWTALHDLSMPGSRANIDHLAIGPGGVVVIDSKNFSGRVSTGSGTLWHGRRPLRRELAAARGYASTVAAALSLDPITEPDVAAVLCIHGADLSEQWSMVDGVIVSGPDVLVPWLASLPVRLHPERVAELADRAHSMLPPRAMSSAGGAPKPPATGAGPKQRPRGRRPQPPRSPQPTPVAAVVKAAPARRHTTRKTDASIIRPVIGLIVVLGLCTATGSRLLVGASSVAGKAGAAALSGAMQKATAGRQPTGGFTCESATHSYRLTLTWTGPAFVQYQKQGAWTALAGPGQSTAAVPGLTAGALVAVRTSSTPAVATSWVSQSFRAPMTSC